MARRKRTLSFTLTGGGVILLGLLIVLSLFWVYSRLTGKRWLGSLFQAQESRAVYSTLERVDDLALLECAVYRLRVVYPFDFPELPEDLPVLMGRNDFCVISAQVTAGYDLTTLLSLPQDQNLITRTGEEIHLNLGKPEITSFKVADQVVKDKGFPDMAVTPEEWRIIVVALTPLIEQMALDHGIIEEAEQYGRDFFLRLFKGAGYENITILP
jgi:hypothetical protein